MPGPVSETMPSLADRMRSLADQGHARADELRQRADALDAAANYSDALWTPERMLGAWARARRVWSECTGDDLI